jgi:hypothetical protein
MNKTRFIILPALIAATTVGATAADARRGGDNDDRKQVAGSCTGNSTSKLKAKTDDGRLEVEFEVDQNRSGVDWRVKLRQNGDLVANTTRTTGGRSGSFSLERKVANQAGTDRFRAVARRGGETCRATLSY